MDELVGRVEIAAILGLSQQRVHQLINRPDFPRPLATLAIGQVWDRAAIEDWARSTGRIGGDDDEPL